MRDQTRFRVKVDRLANGAWIVGYTHNESREAPFGFDALMQCAGFEKWEDAEKYIMRLTRKLLRDAAAEEMKKELPKPI